MCSSEFWKVVLNELKGSLHSAKEMFNASLKIESIEEDEKFDCQLIELIVDTLIPCNREIVSETAVDLVFQVARITKFKMTSWKHD